MTHIGRLTGAAASACLLLCCGGGQPVSNNVPAEDPGPTPLQSIPDPSAPDGSPSQATADAAIPAEPPEPSPTSVKVTVYSAARSSYGSRRVSWLLAARQTLGKAMELNIEYLANDDGGEIWSARGPCEIAASMTQLCAMDVAPESAWSEFLLCQNRDLANVPSGWPTCAEKASIDPEKIRQCVTGGRGGDLLRKSVQASEAADAHPGHVYIGDERMLFNQENEYVQHLCMLLGENAPQGCEQLPPLPWLPVTVLEDARCTEPAECAEPVEEELRRLKLYARLAIQRVSATSVKGVELREKAKVSYVPALVIPGRGRAARSSAITTGYERTGRSRSYFIRVLGRFDPTAGRLIPHTKVPVTIVTDSRCKTDECGRLAEFQKQLAEIIPGGVFTKVDSSSKVGQALFKRFKTEIDAESKTARRRGLPLIYFGAELRLVPHAYERYKRWARSLGGGYAYSMGGFDPDAEICDNQVDDDGNGQVDCRDSGCSSDLACQPKVGNRLEVFVMSQCPFAAKVMQELPAVVSHFGKSRSKIDLRIEYVGTIDGDTLSTMHGQDELEEDLRQVCAQHHYKRGYLALDYIACRAKNYRSNDWQSCVPAKMKASVISRCAEGKLGAKLLRKSFERAKSAHRRSSPSWLFANSSTKAPKTRTANHIVEAFCEHSKNPACATRPEPVLPPHEACGEF